MAETITGVANLYEGGFLIALPKPHRHYHLFATAALLQIPLEDHVQGFTTSEGRFVDRKEARKIVEAAGQPNRKSGSQNSDELFSEDVW